MSAYKLSCIIPLLLFLITRTSSTSFPKRTNVIVIVDVPKTNDRQVIKHVWKLLDGISLRKHRIALSTTSGVTQRLVNYQSRECTVKKLHTRRLRHKRLSLVIKHASRDIYGEFNKDGNIFIILTDRPLDHYARYFLKKVNAQTNNIRIDVIQLKYNVDDFPIYALTTIKDLMKTTLEDVGSFNEVLNQLTLYEGTLKTCPANEKTVYDECKRQCECIDGRLVNCYRVRSQFSKLSLKDRVYYINVYKRLATNERFKRPFYKLLKMHPTVNFRVLHSKKQLLAFHRKYALVFENFLRLVDCQMTIPYWNFALHSRHLFKHFPGYHMWDNIGGFGSTKTSIRDSFCVRTGPFRYPHWKLPVSFVENLNEDKRLESICMESFKTGSHRYKECMSVLGRNFHPRCLTRLRQPIYKVPTYKHIYNILHSNETSFAKFEYFLRMECHGSIHDNMGGDFGYGYSSVLPEFFPLHSMLDAIWDYWERKGNGPKYKGHWEWDRYSRIVGFHTPRWYYLDNDNLENCGVKIKYTDIFPKKLDPPQKKDEDEGEEEEFIIYYF